MKCPVVMRPTSRAGREVSKSLFEEVLQAFKVAKEIKEHAVLSLFSRAKITDT